MATTINGYPNAKTDGNPLSATEVNTLSDGSELHHVNLCELFGAGVINATDWNLGIVAGQIALTITAGQGIVGDAGERKVCATTSSVTITSTQGLAAGSPTTYYIFKKRDLGTVGDDATGFVAQTSSVAPADSILIGSASMGASEAASVNNWPSGRVNLKTVGTAWYEPSTFTFIVDCPVGEDRVFEVDFISKGQFGNAGYFIILDHDQDDAKTQVWAADHGKTGSKFRCIVQNASDAAAGTYGTSAQVQIVCQLIGRLWTPAASPSAPTITVSTFGGGESGDILTDYLKFVLATSTSQGVLVGVTGDAVQRGHMRADGMLEWGDGAATRDTNLYRSAANKLKTDDMLLAVLGLGVGNSAAASTLGTVTKKMQVFDASGASLGYCPIYDAIT